MFKTFFRRLFGNSTTPRPVQGEPTGAPRRRGSSALSGVLESLEEIGDAHSELYDTDVRERLWQIVEHRVVRAETDYPIPADLGMFSDDANRKLHAVLERGLSNLLLAFEVCGLRTPEQRLHSLQNPGVKTPRHQYTYEEFLGSP